MYKIVNDNVNAIKYFEQKREEQNRLRKLQWMNDMQDYKDNKDIVLKEYKKLCKEYYQKFNPKLLENGYIKLDMEDLTESEYNLAKIQIEFFKKKLDK